MDQHLTNYAARFTVSEIRPEALNSKPETRNVNVYELAQPGRARRFRVAYKDMHVPRISAERGVNRVTASFDWGG